LALSNRRIRERERKTNEIIDAAQKHFFKKGYNKTTMDEIAAELELTKPALYRYFTNKEDLFFAVVQRGNEILSKMMKKEVESCNMGLEKILATGYAFWRFYDQYHDYCMVMLEARNIYPQCMDAPYFQKIREHDQDYMEIMCGAIETGKKDGSIRENIDTFLTALYLAESTIAVLRSSEATSDVLNLLGVKKAEFIKHSLNLMTLGISQQPLRKNEKKISQKDIEKSKDDNIKNVK